MTEQSILSNKARRKKAIVTAALKCFLQFGYAKTSMNDVAKEVGLSRQLIYLAFKNKEDLYIGVIAHLTEGQLEAVEKALHSNQPKKIKLTQVYEILLLEPWEKIMGKPMSADFYKVSKTLFHEVSKKYKDQTLKCTQRVLVDKKISELFILAVEGLKSDLPDTITLRNRLNILIDHFI